MVWKKYVPPGGDSQELAQLILADSRRHGGLGAGVY